MHATDSAAIQFSIRAGLKKEHLKRDAPEMDLFEMATHRPTHGRRGRKSFVSC
jgi:hypothetical protein